MKDVDLYLFLMTRQQPANTNVVNDIKSYEKKHIKQ